MTTKALSIKQRSEPKFKVRKYNRCQICGRRRGFYRKFQLCRICFRNLAWQNKLPGVRKASW
ncbi:MAG: type Z 30S ribosomal protein S14 [Planctomycetes bacterium]|nr:type Z 30S ribosomal protein S14 [Planctomycetota bacterium]